MENDVDYGAMIRADRSSQPLTPPTTKTDQTSTEVTSQESVPLLKPTPSQSESYVAPSTIVQSADDNEYVSLIRDEKVSKENDLKQSVYAGHQKNPDETAKIVSMANKVKVSPALLEDDISLANDLLPQTIDYRKMVSQNPRLSGWLQKPNNAAMTHDDLPAMQKVEDTVSAYGLLKTLHKSFNSNFYSGLSSAAKIPAFVYELGAIPQNAIAKLSGHPDRQVEAPDWAYNNPVTKFFDRTAQMFHTPEMDTSIIDEAVNNGDYKKAGIGFATQVVGAMPQTLILLSTGAAGYGRAGLALMGTESAAEKRSQLNAVQPGEPGYLSASDPLTATGNAALHGTLEAASENIGTMGLFKKWSSAISLRYGKQGAIEIFKDFGKVVAHSSFGEGSEEGINSFAQDLNDWATGVTPDFDFFSSLRRAGDAFLVGFGSGTTTTGPASIAAGISRATEKRNADTNADFYVDVNKELNNTKLKERSPEATKDLVKDMVKGTDGENVHINAQVFNEYFQSTNISPSHLAASMGVSDQYNDGLESGGDIKVPMEVWVEKLGDTPHHNALKNDIMLKDSNPNAMSVNEVNKSFEEAKAAMKAEEEAAKEQAAPPSAEEIDQTDRVTENIVEQLKTNLNMSDKDARTNAEVLRGIYTLAVRTGQKPDDLFKTYGLRIQAGEGDQVASEIASNERVLEQARLVGADGNLLTVDFGATPAVTPEQSGIVGADGKVLKPDFGRDQVDIELAQERSVLQEKQTKFLGKKILAETSDHGKQMLSAFSNRFMDDNEQKPTLAAIKKAQSPTEGPYVNSTAISGIGWIPNYSAKPTGVIGEPRIQEPFTKGNGQLGAGPSIDPLAWAEGKYRATKELIIKHREAGLPLVINTSSDFVATDTYIAEMPADTTVNMYMLTRDDNINKVLFPGNASVLRQENAVKRLRDAGIKVNVIRPTVESILDGFDKKDFDKRMGTSKAQDRNAIIQRAVGLTVLNQDNLTPEEEQRIDTAIRVEIDKEFTDRSFEDKKKEYNTHKDAKGGKVVSADISRDLSKYYRDNPLAHSSDTQVEASKFSRQLLTDKLSEPATGPLMITGGGSGSGKTSSVDNLWSDKVQSADIIFDGTLKRFSDAKKMIEMAFTTGRDVVIGYVFTHLDETVPRAIGRSEKTNRIVPPDVIVESNVESLKTIKELAKVYSEEIKDGRLTIYLADNTGDYPVEITVDELNAIVYTEPVKDLIAKADKQFIEKGVYERIRQARERARREFVEKSAKASDLARRDESQDKAGLEGNARITGISRVKQEGPRGRIKFGADRQFIIELMKTADKSTFLHESGHLYLEVLGDLAEGENAPQQIKDDYDIILKWLGVNSRSEVNTEHHEKWARAFESYLMEGKAPSNALRQAFARFKVWLINVYKVIRLNNELSDDIRGVMDRMLATDEEIATAREHQYVEPLFGRVGAYKMTDSMSEKYTNAFDRLKEAAETKVMTRLMDDYSREAKAFYKEERDIIKSDVTKNVEEQRAYKTIDQLQKGKTADGQPLKLSKKDILNMWGSAGFEKIKNKKGPYVYSRDGGLHPDVAATMFGYESGDQLLQEIANAPDKATLIDQLTDARMDAKYPDALTDGTLPALAIDALYDEARSDIIKMEMKMALDFLNTNEKGVLKDVIKRTARRVPTDKVVRAQAEKIIGNKPVEEIRPYDYLVASRKAAKLAGEALAKGDLDEVFNQKQKELLNNELYRSARNAKEHINKSLKMFKKLKRPDDDLAKTRDMDLINAARSIVGMFGLGKIGKAPESYLASLKQYDPDAYNGIMVLVDAATEGAKSYKEVSYNDFVEMSDAVEAMWDLSKSLHEIEIDGKKMQMAIALDHMEKRISEVAKPKALLGYNKAVTDAEKTGMKILAAAASLKRVEHWAHAIDGVNGGPMTTYIWNPISEATTKYRVEKIKVMEQLETIIKEVAPKLTTQAIHSPELNYTFKDKAEVMMFLLHSGNQSNVEKLIRGRGWGEFNADGVVDESRHKAFLDRMFSEGVIGKAEIDAAQKIWDLMEQLKPDAQIAHKKMYGYHFNEITARELVTPFGTYRGGYIPAKVDIYTNEDQAIRQEREEFESNNNSYQFPTTGRGFTKARVNQYAAPLLLDLSLISGHIDSVLRFTHIEPHVKDVARMVTNKGFRKSLATVDTEVAKFMLVPWLQRAATQKVVIPSTTGLGRLLDSGARFLRANVAMQIMTGAITNAMQQFTGFSIAAIKVKPRHLRNAMVSYVKDFRGTVDHMVDKSDFMSTLQSKTIFESQDAINQIILNPSTFEKTQNFMKRHTYFLQAATQNIVNTVTWTGAYEQAIGNGSDEKQAVREADAAVRMTQGTNNPEDISQYETGTHANRLFTQFSGYFNMVGNLNASELQKISRDTGLKRGAGRAFYVYTLGLMIPAVVSQLMVQLMSGKGFDADDDDEYLDDLLSLFFGSQIKTLTAMVPFVGPVTNVVINKFNANPVDDRLNYAPVISTLESMASTPQEVYKGIVENGELKKKAAKDVLMLLGVMSGLPIGPLGKPIGYMMDVSSRKANPTGPVDFTRGLVTGQPGSQ